MDHFQQRLHKDMDAWRPRRGDREPKNPAVVRTIRHCGYIFSSAVMRLTDFKLVQGANTHRGREGVQRQRAVLGRFASIGSKSRATEDAQQVASRVL